MKTNIKVGTIINGRHTATGKIFLGRVTKLPKNNHFKLEFEYLENFGRKRKRGQTDRIWKCNVWKVNSKQPSITNMKFRKKNKPKQKVVKKITKTTTIGKKIIKTTKITTTITTIIK